MEEYRTAVWKMSWKNVRRSVADHCRRRGSAEWPVVANIVPDAGHVGFVFSQQRHGSVVAMQSPGSQHVGLDQHEHRPQGNAHSADLISQRRQA
jgi:hypothetical protein